ncbi:hypothetical protein SDC9_102256 [bioreactor metagenome]|uniref:Uncharacterized protein n=1 Tax=bioreactor metagenome TaxID=1076179 RepID=A0A645AQV0_9ZZZZ
MDWCCQSGFPKVTRSLAYFTASSIARCARPTDPAATLARPPSNVFMAAINPMPSSPIKFSIGTTTLSKITSAVLDRREPILFSSLPIDNPGRSRSTIKAEMPFEPLLLSVTAMTKYRLAGSALVIKHFVPLIM